MNVHELIFKWSKAALTERSAAHQHFLDLCAVVGHPTPAEVDPEGDSFTFEKGVAKYGGGRGWADVWKRGCFGWEYKRQGEDLAAAYGQLLRYREALENPPLLVVCDMDRIVVHTNFTGRPTVVHDLALRELDKPGKMEILRAVFHDPERLRPGVTREAITQEAASRFAEIAQTMRGRGLPPPEVARFLDRLVFLLFAQSVDLLPAGLVGRLLDNTRDKPELFTRLLGSLFQEMAGGGFYGADRIRWFNGNLFSDAAVLTPTKEELRLIVQAGKLDWSAIDPSVLGTLFERGLDPDKRSQLGAHYTSRADIETLIDPVVLRPLRREWDEVRRLVENLLATGKKNPTDKDREKPAPEGPKLRKAREEVYLLLRRYFERLGHVRVLDPACGSGNFLYVTLQKLKDLEKEVILYGMAQDFSAFLPLVSPRQLHGIEINPYAFELAQMSIWIGYLQWTRANGFIEWKEPILEPMDSFQCKDAILDLSDPENPHEPEWPAVDYIVGNPPFLGTKKLRSILGDEYVESLFKLYGDRIPNFSDLCCYWFEKARAAVEQGRCQRVGLLATQAIRGGLNRRVLDRIRETGEIFFAWSDRSWVLDGASVHVSMVGFDDGSESERTLDGKPVESVNSNLTSASDVGLARPLAENKGLGYYADVKAGRFEMPLESALAMLREPNPAGAPNSDVLLPWANGRDVLTRPRGLWIVDFDVEIDKAALYEAPFGYARQHVYPKRKDVKRDRYRELWWQHAEPCTEMRRAIAGLERYVVTPVVSKHRVFVWFDNPSVPDHMVFVCARDDDYFLGALHSRLHEVWARSQGTQVRERESGFRYTPTSCFETFPFPRPTPEQADAIAAAAKELDALRNRWLNPPEWTREEVLEFPGSLDGPWARYVHDPDARGIGTVRYPRLVARDDEAAAQLKKRTLTNLYNERPTWLDLAHRRLDETVAAAYGWPADLTDDQILERLLALNLERVAEA